MSRTQERERARLMEGTTAEGGDEPHRGLGVGPGRLVMRTPGLQGRPPHGLDLRFEIAHKAHRALAVCRALA